MIAARPDRPDRPLSTDLDGPCDPQIAARAGALHRDALVWDNHGCMPDYGVRPWLKQLDHYRQGGAAVAMINIGDGQFPLEHLIRMAAEIRAYVLAHPSEMVMATSTAAIRQAKAEGRLAVGLDIEGAQAFGDQLSLIQLFHDLGVRWMLLVYNRRNLIGSGCHDAEDEGLTAFGRAFCAEMDRVGMVKCCTHAGYRTAMEVMGSSDVPSIFSHSNPRALREHPRNITDEMIDACAAGGGVVCINGVGLFLGEDNRSTPRLIADHIDYVAQRVGARHVGVGLDYVFDRADMEAIFETDGHTWPRSWGYRPGISFMSPSELPGVTEQLMRRGWPDDDIRAVIGGNLMRIAEQVWK